MSEKDRQEEIERIANMINEGGLGVEAYYSYEAKDIKLTTQVSEN